MYQNHKFLALKQIKIPFLHTKENYILTNNLYYLETNKNNKNTSEA